MKVWDAQPRSEARTPYVKKRMSLDDSDTANDFANTSALEPTLAAASRAAPDPKLDPVGVDTHHFA